ncbi:MAG: polysaccharide biosynthesis tyrosine autokinase [Sphaerochaetaceae bacterium]|nr:polysaccharide biosynthesis tyrosine autokinase [Sphaerochaetaceae bacterium]
MDTFTETPNEYDREQEGLSITELLHILKVRFIWIVITFVVVMAGAVAYLQTVTPMYESEVTLLVDSLEKGTDIESMLLGQNTQNISTEVELTLSRTNINQALERLDLSEYVTEDGESYTDPAVLGNIKERTSVTTVKDTNIVRITVRDQNKVFARDFANAIAESYDDLLGSIARNSKTVQKEFIQSQIPLNEQELKRAADQLGTFREESNYIQLSDKSKLLSEKIAYFQLRREPLMLQKQEAVITSNGYRAVMDASEGMYLSSQQIREDEKLLSILESYENLLKEMVLYEAIAEGVPENSVRLYELENSLSISEKDMLDRITTLLAPINPVDSSVALAAREYGKVFHQLLLTEAEIEVLSGIESSFAEELSQLPQLERTLLDLQREVEVYEALRMRLMELLEEVRIAEAAVVGSVTVVDPAMIKDIPVSPNVMLILAVAVLLGVALGVLLAILREMADITIKDESVIKKIVGPTSPLLGWIPLMSYDNEEEYPSLIVNNSPLSFESERYKLIANNITFGTLQQSQRVFSITSAGMGEGKTTVAINIATSMAMNGQKVLLIDGDLRLPQVGAFFNHRKAPSGLVDVITKGIPVEQVIVQPLKKVSTLHLLPPGVLPPLPSAIFNSPQYVALIDYLLDTYDYILIDTPPLLFASELMAIAKHVDGLAINVRAGITTKGALQELVDNLNLGGVNILGVIFNGVIESKMGGHYSGGRYYAYRGYSYTKRYYSDRYDSSEKKEGKKQTSYRTKGGYRKNFLKDLAKREQDRHLGTVVPIYPYLDKVDPFADVDGGKVEKSSSSLSGDILSDIESDDASRGRKE